MDPLDTFYDKFMKSTNKFLDRDVKYKSILKDVTSNIHGIMQNSTKMNSNEKRRRIQEIEKLYDKAEKLVEEKTYIIDSLDESIIADRKELIENNRQDFEGIDDDALMIDVPDTSDESRQKKKQKKSLTQKPRKTLAEKAAETRKRKREDVPADSSLPIYCSCRQIEFGEMVECDNKKCKVGWYHFACVEMTQAPEDNVKWFCEQCRHRFKDVPNQWNYETNEPPNEMIESSSRKTRKSIQSVTN